MSLFPWRRQKRLMTPPSFGGPAQSENLIRTGERLSRALFGEQLTPDEYLRRLYPKAQIPPLSQVVATARPLVARVNNGNWIVSCECGARGVPSPGCLVFTDTPLVFDVRCGNASTGRGWRPVILPPVSEREQIERVLLCRPNALDQNWEPGESIETLLRENREHGDPVPGVRNGLRHAD